MKKSAGLLLTLLLGYVQVGLSFGTTPLIVVTSPVAAVTGTAVPMTATTRFGVVATVLNPVTWQIGPCANGQVTVTVSSISGPVSVSGTTDSQGNAILNVPITVPTLPYTTQAAVSAVCPNPPYGTAIGSTTGIIVNVSQLGPQPQIHAPVLAQ